MALLAAIFFGFVPCLLFAYILYWLDRYEKEPILLLGMVFFWGMVVAAGGAYVLNTLFGEGAYLLTGSAATSDIATGSLSAPFVEESLKGMAVLLVFLFFRSEFDSLLDGIIYAGIAALGFAATENTIYIWRGYQSAGWEGFFQLVFIRVIVVGWQHPFYTAFTGIGLAIARMHRNWLIKIGAPLAGWGTAMFTHSVHNTLASIPFFGDLTCLFGTFLDYTGLFFMFLVVLWATWQEQKNIINYLREEVQLGLISREQYRTACSAWLQMFARLASLFEGHYRATARFYQTIGELAHKKNQYAKLGEEGGNLEAIQKYRETLKRLAPLARA